jgi:hypothetical protein
MPDRSVPRVMPVKQERRCVSLSSLVSKSRVIGACVSRRAHFVKRKSRSVSDGNFPRELDVQVLASFRLAVANNMSAKSLCQRAARR